MGFAVWGEEGLLFSGQAEPFVALVDVVPFLRRSSVALVAVETAFVGKGAHASLSSAAAGGFVLGALWASSVRPPEIWEPKASAWRKDLGFSTWLEEPKGRRRKKREDYEEDARSFAGAVVGRRFSRAQTHEAEAICMASAGWERWIEKQSLGAV